MTTQSNACTSDSYTDEFLDAEYLEKLQRHLRRRLPSDEDARDLAQEACLRFVVEFRRRSDIRNPQGYLFTIANNLLFQHYNREKPVHVAIDLDSLAASQPASEEQLIDDGRLELIRKAWQELPAKCQMVLHLRWKQGLRVKEIAEAMQLSTSMVKKYLTQGLAHCRKRLDRIVEKELRD